MRAPEAFGDPQLDPFTVGQVYPRRLGLLLKERGTAVDPDRELTEVRVYRGEPDARQSATAQAACQRQVGYWQSQERVTAITRPLRYRPVAWKHGRPAAWEAREKGIDVLLALDMAMGAVSNAFDVAVLVSADTDLVPALEAVLQTGKRVEVAWWRPQVGYAPRLGVPGRNVWCHWLDRRDLDRVRDDTDHTRAPTGGG